MDMELLESQLAVLPLYGYFFIDPRSLEFSERIRWICEHECPMCNRTWACPPGVGSVEHCKEKCLSHENCLMIATIVEVNVPLALPSRKLSACIMPSAVLPWPPSWWECSGSATWKVPWLTNPSRKQSGIPAKLSPPWGCSNQRADVCTATIASPAPPGLTLRR